jgi:hypothetical protein
MPTSSRRALRALAAAVVATGTAALSLALGATSATATTIASATASALAATSRDAAPAGLTWHKFPLRNNWRQGSLLYGAGWPSWAMANGIVYLSGGAQQKTGDDQVIALLPRGARPAKTVLVGAYTSNNTLGAVGISPAGRVIAYGSPQSNAQGFISLAGITFPAARTSRHLLTLVNGWQPFAPSTGAAPPAYTIAGGVVHLSGDLAQPSPGSDLFARLPRPARPSHVLYVAVFTETGIQGTAEIKPDGTMYAFHGTATSFTSLDGVSFPLPSARSHPLALRDGWASSQPDYDSGNPAYSVINGVVHLSGSLHQPVSRQGAFAVLPRGARPAHFMYINVYQFDGVVGFVLIYPDGKAYISGDDPSAWQGYTSLASVSYPVGP